MIGDNRFTTSGGFYAIVGGTFVVPLAELPDLEMDKLKKDSELWRMVSIPVYFSRSKENGLRLWPYPASKVEIVQTVPYP